MSSELNYNRKFTSWQSRSLKTGAKLAVQSVIGGTLSELGVGNFANGAITAAFSSVHSHPMHARQMRKQKNRERRQIAFY